MKLLQVPTVELEQRIKDELEANPALEEGKDKEADEYGDDYEYDEGEKSGEDDFDISDYLSDDDTPDYRYNTSNKGPDDESKQMPIGGGTSFHELLLSQLGLRDLDEHEVLLAENIIGNLDDNGYLRRELSSMVNDLAFTQNINTSVEELEKLLMVIQDFDPPGVGARNLRECLLIQIARKKNKDEDLLRAQEILEDHYEEFTKKHYSKIIKRMEISEDQLRDAMDEIVRLNPKPGNSLKESSKTVQHIVPDFLLTIEEDELNLQLNQRNAPELRVSKQYQQMLEGYSKDRNDKKNKDAILFVKQRIDAAKWFIDAIVQRQLTLMLTMNAIMEYQEEYFLTGDETKLKPMILKDIAEKVSMDISTVSRVANSKYVQTPYGTFLLKSFFSESIATESGEEVSSREVKKILMDAVENEDKKKPLTDQKLAEILKEKGYVIARRTIAKYRKQLKIPVARMRKEL